MTKKSSILISVATISLFIFAAQMGVALNKNKFNASILGADQETLVARAKLSPETKVKVDTPAPAKEEPKVSCDYDIPKKESHSAEIVDVRSKLKVKIDEQFRVKFFVKNTGNTPWFSVDSGCSGPIANLGTDNERDHKSFFYSPDIKKDDNHWIGTNRVSLDQLRVDPGEVASFTFWANAGHNPDAYKEYMTPLIEGIGWLNGANTSFNIIVGEPSTDPGELLQRFIFSGTSGSVMDLDLDAERKITVDLSEQSMQVYLGDNLVRKFFVSTGAAKTPTPPGNYKIILKQEVRVAGKAPHYVMPKFMMFKAGGYGIHALPSLSRKGGDLFWTEARNHIGRPVSHGCIRVLPEEAEFLYSFADVGTAVVVQR